MSRTIDLNTDLGEGFPWDQRLLDLVTSTSVSCGSHAGDQATIESTLAWAVDRAVLVGAHPGYDDREGFGRRERPCSRAELRTLVVEQVERLRTWASLCGAHVSFIKAHGALYNQAQRDQDLAEGLVDSALECDLPLLGQPGTVLERTARERGVLFFAEGFPDRRYETDGRLAPRSSPGSSLYEPAEVRENLARLLDQGVKTLCVHGDDERSVAQAGLLREWLADRGWTPRHFLSEPSGGSIKG